MMKIKEVVNKILWSVNKEDLKDYYLIIIDRVAQSGFKKIPFSKIVAIDNAYVYIMSDNNDICAIPIHRIVKILKVNTIIYDRYRSSKTS